LTTSPSRVISIAAVALTIAALSAAPVGSAGNPTLRNDKAHFPERTAPARTANGSPAPVIVQVDGGFDWTAAAVGAVGGLGVALVAGGAASALRRRQPADEASA
jgi:hypothetical protein